MSVRAALDMHAFTIELSSLRHSVLYQEKLTSQEPFSSNAAAKRKENSQENHFHFNNSFSNVNHFSIGVGEKSDCPMHRDSLFNEYEKSRTKQLICC